jgi:phosphoesterase RecJ-like protein
MKSSEILKSVRQDLEEFRDLLLRCGKIALFAHVSPDGDTLGSCFALKFALERLGKEVEIICMHEVPEHLSELFDPRQVQKELHFEPQLAVAVDCADLERMGVCRPLFEAVPLRAVIDHHNTNPGFGQVNVVCAQAAATGSLIWKLLKMFENAAPGCREAEYIYIALSTDTGNFSFSNTNADCFEVMAELMEGGLQLLRPNQLLFRTRTQGKTRMLGVALWGMQMCCGDKGVYSIVTMERAAERGVFRPDSDGAIDFLRDIDTVEVAAFACEVDPNVYKVSLRSKNYANVAEVARQYEGGGHERAAGCRLRGSKEEVAAKIEELLAQILQNSQG